MTLAVSFAHAQHADFLMLDLEAFVFKSGAVNGGAELRSLGWRDSTHLKEHSFDYAVDLSINIAQ